MNPPFDSTELRSSVGVDFVRTDAATLAEHMRRCNSSRGRFFEFQTTLQELRDALFGHIVTVAACTVVVVGVIVLA